MFGVTNWLGKQILDREACVGCCSILQTWSLPGCWQAPWVRAAHYSHLTCCPTVPWPQAKQNEGPCSALGSRTPDCAFQQTERGFEVCLPSACPKQGDHTWSNRQDDSGLCRLGGRDAEQGSHNWADWWAHFQNGKMYQRQRHQLIPGPLCCFSVVMEKPSILYLHLNMRISVLWPLCIESKANPTARHYNCLVNSHLVY